MHLPVIEHFRPSISARQRARVEGLAERLRQEYSMLAVEEQFKPLVCEQLEDGSALHIDDLSSIPYLDRAYDVTFMQDRARLRAGTGDWLVSCSPPQPAFEEYCRGNLGLGAPAWLHAAVKDHPLRVASACWADREVRRNLVHALRAGDLHYVHPHMGNFAVWQLAAMLRESSRQQLKVIAPPPGLTQWVNDKLAFADTIQRLFGEASLPRTEEAANFSTLANRVRDLSADARCIGFKLPDSAGGGGNLVVDADRFRGRSLRAIRSALKPLLARIWKGESRLLVGAWETDVVCAPSAQLWIPPLAQGPPILEGLYKQVVVGREGFFVGNKPAESLGPITEEMIDHCCLLALLYQHLGYVGRCSFDMLLVGADLARSRLQFVECNGRWGGTSAPMTLMNRIFGDWTSQPYAAQECIAPRLGQRSFSELLDYFARELYDVRVGNGRLIFYNPGRMQAQQGIDALVLADSWDEAQRIVQNEVPQRLSRMVGPGSRRLLAIIA